MRQIVFVCTGNTCRSPMAEILFTEICKKRAIKDFTATSCGVRAQDGAPMNALAVESLREAGIFALPHTAKSWQVPSNLALVIVMTTAHKQIPELKNAQTLGELTDGKDVADPFMGSIESYRRVREQLTAQISMLVDKLVANEI